MRTSGYDRILLTVLVAFGFVLVAGGCGGGGGGGPSNLPSNNPPSNLPTLTISAPDNVAAESGGLPDTGLFRISRTGGVTGNTEAVTVEFTVEGSVSNALGADFVEAVLGPTIDIPAGSDSVDIEVSPMDDAEIEGLETLLIRILPNAAYSLGQDSEAAVEFIDDDTIVEDISVAEAESRIIGEQANPLFMIVDVRTPAEFAAGHIEDAVNIDVLAGDFGERIAELDPAGTYLIHCKSGSRSAPARDQMAQRNIAIIWNMEDGFDAWKAAGYPVSFD